jgi:hypothetical protein
MQPYGELPWSAPPAQHPPQSYPPPANLPAFRPASGPPVPYPVSTGVPYPGMPHDVPVLRLGEITVTGSTVHTPLGSCPLRGSRWHAQDQWIVSQRTPVWAIVLAVVGFCVLTVFSLLFLLAKETVYHGVIMVTVSHGPFTYTARLPVFDQQGAQHVHNQVNYVRAMAVH